jgi:choline dehydrogenase-like flavoprotein
MTVAVIGSGVAGISAARALSNRGYFVTILDVGETIDLERHSLVERSGTVARHEDSPIGGGGVLRSGGLPEKLHFGSDYIYGFDRPFALTTALDAPYPTYAKGGFSNIWSAAVLPTDGCDMADWPVSRGELEPYFRKAAEMLPLTGGIGTLSRSFPAYKQTLGEIDPGPQGRLLLDDLQRAESDLLMADTLYGRARLAVHTEPGEGEVLPCNGCGQCSFGCARGSISSTVPMLDGMIRRKEVAYRGGIFISRITETDSKAIIEGIDLAAMTQVQLAYDSVFVAAGPINTTRLLLRSRELYNRPVRLKESQRFVVPMLRRRPAATTWEIPSVTLAAAFIETKVSVLSDHWVHAQIVSMNRTISDNSRLLGLARSAGRKLWAPVLRHVMMAWCGMHSDHSSHLEVRLNPGHDGQPDRLRVESQVSNKARAAARAAAKHLFQKGRLFDTLFCYWMPRFSYPGRATHCGSSFPMRSRPIGEFDSDRFGRPFNWSRIFVVDSSVLPSIPGTTTAFPVMANAYRIGSEAPL